MLGADQIDAFKADGHLILPGFVDAALVAQWRDQCRIEGTFRETPEWDERGWGIFSDDGPEPPREFVARAGDLILWHGWLCHSGSTNVNATPRVGFFARWVHEDDAGVRRSIPADPWHHWAI
ncbi:MAG: hypothetical protein QGH25_04810 [Candidatus Latescibacteria bacterium]|jgi:hypothetical protein|nr:hypothetical protein [Candidatus Latescibacterota bacterium]